ncbi:hypothetical protein D3C72_1583810 [compost metagenome]
MKQQGIGIGAHGVEADKTQIQQARKAHHNVQAQAQHHIDKRQGGNIDRVAATEEGPDDGCHDHQPHQGGAGAVLHGRQAWRLDMRHLLGQKRLDELQHQHDHKAPDHQVPVWLDVIACAFALQVQAEDGQHHQRRQHGGNQCILEIRFHQTFSTSGLPRRPVGRNSRIRTRRPKATMSLYSDEM